jgi:hypothetical protein
MKRIIFVLICLLMFGCSTGKSTPVKAKIIKVVDDFSNMGCIGTYKKTVFKTEKGNVSQLCGDLGREGDEVLGYWTEGHFDSFQNGFSLTK